MGRTCRQLPSARRRRKDWRAARNLRPFFRSSGADCHHQASCGSQRRLLRRNRQSPAAGPIDRIAAPAGAEGRQIADLRHPRLELPLLLEPGKARPRGTVFQRLLGASQLLASGAPGRRRDAGFQLLTNDAAWRKCVTDHSATSPHKPAATAANQSPRTGQGKAVSADEGNTLTTLANLWPYILSGRQSGLI